jgi:hypothetical protein
LISRQIDVLGDKAYDKLKLVYSVWILVNDIPEELKNSVQSVCNPYHEHSKKIEEEVNAMLSAADEIEIRARQEGRAEENAKVFRENVRRMFSQGFSCEIIAKALGSTIEEVNDVLSDTSEDSFEDAKLFK